MGKGFTVLSEYPQGRDRFMEGSLKELIEYRLARAEEDRQRINRFLRT